MYILSDNGRFIASTSAKSYAFVGKATRTSISYTSEQAGVGRRYYYYLSGGKVTHTVSTIAASAGTAKLQFDGSCGSSTTFTWSLSDSSAIAVYEINSAYRPLVFVRSTANSSGAVASIVLVSGTLWRITVVLGYSARTYVDSVELYCFAPISDAPSGYGIALYGADGSVLMHTGKKLLQPAASVTVNSATTDGSTITVDYDASTSLSGVTKPCVLSVDWFRASVTHKASDLSRALLSSSTYGCYYSGCNVAKLVTQRVVSLGFYVSGGAVTFKAASVSTDAPIAQCSGGQAAGTSLYHSLVTTPLPVTLPVIDGAFYD